MSQPIEKLRAALSLMHKRACGDTNKVYMSIPARPDVDADLLLMGALDELERLRADLARVRREALEEAARVAETPTGHWEVGTKRTPYWDGAKVAAALRSLASTPRCRAGHAWQESVGYCDATGCDQPLASTPEAP